MPWLHAVPPPATLVLTAFYFACAAFVTIDVLLKKNDVRGALGWIAIAWLSPVLGAVLYYLFGINRVTRRALKLDTVEGPQRGGESIIAPAIAAPNIAALAEIAQRVTKTPLTAGNNFTLLHGGAIAYPAMLHAIRGASRSIAMASYIFRDDDAGRQFIDALAGAQARGVEVRVLLDGIGAGYFWSAALQQLNSHKVPAAQFLHTWIPWRMPFLNMRNHRKLLVVDGAIGFVGGMNIGAEYAAAGPGDAVEDVQFRVEGPVVRQIMDAFCRDWTFATDEMLDQDIWWPALDAAGATFARGLRSGPDADIYKLEVILGAALTQAQRRIRIVTPYFLPDQRLQFAIAQAVLRGVQVDIFIPERSDNRLVDWAARAHLRFFRYAGANFYFTPLPFDHSKLVTMDGEWCLIGSSNWDTRSFRLNFEFDLESYGGDLPAALDRLIDEKLARARKLERESPHTPLWKRLRDAAARLLLPYL